MVVQVRDFGGPGGAHQLLVCSESGRLDVFKEKSSLPLMILFRPFTGCGCLD